MYKISIIEDEPIMRKYLSNCLDWGKLNLELSGVYSKKETALKGILKNGTDDRGCFYSVYTWTALMYFYTDIWR